MEEIKGIDCFNKKPFEYFNGDDLSTLTFASWHLLTSQPSKDELTLDEKLKRVRMNLTKFEQALREGRIHNIPMFLKNNGFQHMLVKPEVVSAVCSYLLYLVSCHDDPVLVNSAADTLAYHVQGRAPFAPHRSQILAIFTNMGLSEEFLPPFSPEELPSYVRGQKQKQEAEAGGQSEAGGAEGHPRQPSELQHFNVKMLVTCLAELLRADGARWDDAARDTLFCCLAAMLVDTRMSEELLLTPHVTICLDRLLCSYPSAHWITKMQDLVKQVGALPRSAWLLVVDGLPRLGRGLLLRRVTAYYLLQRAVREPLPGCTAASPAGSEEPIHLPASVKVPMILEVLRYERFPGEPLSRADLEHLYAVLTYVDVAVGNERLTEEEKPRLTELQDLMQCNVKHVKDDVDNLYRLRTKLKELMAILSSKWQGMAAPKRWYV